MKSANNEPTTARNTPNPIFAGGRDGALCSRKSTITPSSSQGLAPSRCCESHHPAIAAIPAMNRIMALTGGPLAPLNWPAVHFAARNPCWRRVRCNRRPSDRRAGAPCPNCHAPAGSAEFAIPAQRRASPGIAASLFSFEQAPDQIEQEHKLGEADNQGRHAHEGIEVMGGCRDKGRFANVVIAAGHTEQAQIVHGGENRISPEERDPEAESSKR